MPERNAGRKVGAKKEDSSALTLRSKNSAHKAMGTFHIQAIIVP